AGDRQGDRTDRRRDGGADRRVGRVPDALRHGEGRRERHADRRHPSGRKARRQIRTLSGQGVGMAALLSVADALARVLDGVEPLPSEIAPLVEAEGRVLASDVAALRTQPPADMSAMDGYAVRAADVAKVPAVLKLVGEVAAGRPFDGQVHAGEAARIFTGGVVPPGADTIVIQENTDRDGESVT